MLLLLGEWRACGVWKGEGDLWVWEKSVLPLHSRECEGLKVGVKTMEEE